MHKGDMWAPPYVYIYIYIGAEGSGRERERLSVREFFLFFLFSSLLFLIHGVLIVGIRRAKNESSSTRRGLRLSTKNMGFHR